MAVENPWLMPQGIEDVLPEEARNLEALRRHLLDLYQSWGYELVMPPFIEFIESLLADLGKDLDLKTFKLTDQLTGKTMGVRADMTPQVARIDAHLLNREEPTRLSYLGTVLHTRTDEFAASRSPLQLGCEIYGHKGVASDVEVILLMLATLEKANIAKVTLDLGHVGIFRGLMEQCGLSGAQEAMLFDILQRKSQPEIQAWVEQQDLPSSAAEMLLALPSLNGGESVLEKAKDVLKNANETVQSALVYIEETLALLKQAKSDVSVHIDLAELHGYHYKTGLVFAAYENGSGQEIARGGRYDDIGQAYGRARPATGFSSDLKTLCRIGGFGVEGPKGILAPMGDSPALHSKINELRSQGEVVVYELEGSHCDAASLNCDRKLIDVDGQWQVQSC